MSALYTITCPHCGSTTTVSTGVSTSGSGVGTCKNCRKSLRVHVLNGEIQKVTKT